MNKLKLVLLSFFVCGSLTAQTFLSYGSTSVTGAAAATVDSKVSGGAEEILGSVYLFSEWDNHAVVTVIGGKEFELNNMNFNALESRFVSQLTKDTVFTFSGVEKVRIKNKLFINKNDKFLELLVESKTGEAFFKEYAVKYKKPKVHTIANIVTSPAEYKSMVNYYVLTSTGNLKKIKLKKKEILDSFVKNKKVVESYIKSNRLKFGKELDVIQIFRYYYNQ